MLKKYKAKSCLSITVSLPQGGTTHIKFSPHTGNGSVLYTDDEALQIGLERHPKFGRLFKLDVIPSSINEPDTTEELSDDNKQDITIRSVEMSCNDDAKDFVADRFGISRSKLRTRPQIEKAAQEHGIKIVWTDRNNCISNSSEEADAGE